MIPTFKIFNLLLVMLTLIWPPIGIHRQCQILSLILTPVLRNLELLLMIYVALANIPESNSSSTLTNLDSDSRDEPPLTMLHVR